MHTLSIARFSCIHNDVLRKNPQQLELNETICYSFFPCVQVKDFFLSSASTNMHYDASDLQIRKSAGCLLCQATAQKQDCTSLLKQATEKETVNAYVQATYLCFLCLARVLCCSSSRSVQQTGSLAEVFTRKKRLSRMLCDVCTCRRASTHADWQYLKSGVILQ